MVSATFIIDVGSVLLPWGGGGGILLSLLLSMLGCVDGQGELA